MRSNAWRVRHLKVIKEFLTYLYSREQIGSNVFVLKGGTSLMLCYGLTRFSEDIDLDSMSGDTVGIVTSFCKQLGYHCVTKKNTNTVQRCIIHYGNKSDEVLKVETSYRSMLYQGTYIAVNGLLVYTIDMIANFKVSAYRDRDRIRDLYDLTFIINNYFNQLRPETKQSIASAFAYKGFDYFDYMIKTQSDDFINNNVLANDFLNAWQLLGIPI